MLQHERIIVLSFGEVSRFSPLSPLNAGGYVSVGNGDYRFDFGLLAFHPFSRVNLALPIMHLPDKVG